MAVKMETLELEIKYNADKAVTELDLLAKTLKKVDASKATQSMKSFSGTLKNVFSGVAARQVANVLAKFTKSSMDYAENLNLFTVAMGEYAEEAQKYAETVSEIMGIDPSQWMRTQGVFNTLATGFGIAGDKAAFMSKNLTQLSYDLSSYFNISMADAAQKVQSAFSGELEPVRRLGYDLSQAKLEAIAFSYGIDKSVSSMTQAEKSQLRYIAMMTQVTEAQGDMARTLESPANQLRIMQEQLELAGRAIGNVFIPIINQVLPYVIAFAKAVRNLADAIADFMGFELPEVDYSSVGNLATGAEDVGDAWDSASAKASKYKNTILGIDEINKLNERTQSGSSIADKYGSSFDLDLMGYDFLGGLEAKASELEDEMSSLLNVALSVGSAILSWKIGKSFLDSISALKTSLGKKGILGLLGGIGGAIVAAIAGFALEFGSSYDIGLNGINFWNGLATVIGGALGVTASVVAGGALGAAISVPLAFIIPIVAIKLGHDQKIRNLWESSDAYQEMMIIRDSIASREEIAKEIVIIAETKFEGLEEIEKKHSDALDAINLMYDALERGANPKIIEKYVEVLNSMDLGDIRWEYDETTNTINNTREASILLVEQWKKEAEANAWRKIQEEMEENLARAYIEREYATKDLADAQDLLTRLERDRDDLMSQLYENEKEYAELVKDTTVWTQEDTEALAENAREANTLREKIEALNVGISDQKETIKRAEGAVKNLNETYKVAEEAVKDTEAAFKKFGSEGEKAADKVSSAMRNIQFPKVDFSKVFTTADYMRALGIPGYATGGFPATGQLFLANEAGPEMVGTIGGRTAVANNDQIVAGIAKGVYDAMVAASGSGGDTIIQLVDTDGNVKSEQIISAADRRNRRDGKTVIPVGR